MSGKWYTSAMIDLLSRKKDATCGRFGFRLRCVDFVALKMAWRPRHENFFFYGVQS
jgi:hypothetical protein